MPIPTPFHARTSALCESYEWRNWAGYLAAGTYEPSHEREYYAIRNSVGLIDVSPLFKYEIVGPDALALVDRVMTRDMSRCAVGQVFYSPWCDEAGKTIDDGTIARLAEDRFRVTAAEPNLFWFQEVGYGLNAEVRDVSAELAALAVQGPLSRQLLQEVVTGIDFERLAYYRLAEGQVDNPPFPVTVSRTGYTGDLGYEVWAAPKDAEALWDRLLAAGQAYGALPAGIIGLDIARVEAGLLMLDVDYISAHHALTEAQKSSPFELGLGWAVALDAQPFVGREALRREKEQGSKWAFVGLELAWEHLEELYAEEDLPPMVAGRASRAPVPIYRRGRQVGQVTSQTFSPIVKEYIALGSVLRPYAGLGTPLLVEHTVEYSRKRARARVVETPFFDPPRKKA